MSAEALDRRIQTRSIGVEQWHALAKDGAAPPVTIRLDGDSMRPLVRRNRDYVTIHPLTRPPKVGDVVLFQNAQGRYVVHRVRRMRAGRVQTLGDGCFNPDPWMDESRVLGLAASVRRGSRTISLNNAWARAFGRAWMLGRPIRNKLRSLRSLLGRIYRRLRRMRR